MMIAQGEKALEDFSPEEPYINGLQKTQGHINGTSIRSHIFKRLCMVSKYLNQGGVQNLLGFCILGSSELLTESP
jgi:hypothetical protein